MAVTDAGGEISASIDETNRIRLALGMAPLKGTVVEASATSEAAAAEPPEAEARPPSMGGKSSDCSRISEDEGPAAVMALPLSHFYTGPVLPW